MKFRIKRSNKIECKHCETEFIASRSDTLYCSEKCRATARFENAKFEIPVLPRSGTPGISFNRLTKKWVVYYKHQYKGSFGELDKAKEFHKEIYG